MDTIKFTSRASIKLYDNFYTFEACIEKTVPEGLSEEQYDEFKGNLWEEVTNEVDLQIEDTRELIKSSKKR